MRTLSTLRPCGLIFVAVVLFNPAFARDAASQTFEVQGCNYSSWWTNAWADPSTSHQLGLMRDIGSNQVTLSSIFNVDRNTNTFSTPVGQNDFPGMPAVLTRARALGLRTGVRVNLFNENNHSLIEPWPALQANPAQFFASLKNLILEHARVANQGGADLLVIGVEMNAITIPLYHHYWLDIITSVRSAFAGKISYGYVPNLYLSYTRAQLDQAVSFWQELDYLGLDVYPQLSFSTTPTVSELIGAWYRNPYYNQPNIIANVKRFYEISGKRLLLTEIGFRSVDGAATRPGSNLIDGASDFQEQADLYTAMLTVFGREGDRSWLAGLLLWNCVVASLPSVQYYTTDQTWGWKKDYTIESKPAANIVKAWFAGPSPPARFAVQANGFNVHVSWDSAPGATAYQIEAGTGPGLSNIYVGDVGNVTALAALGPAGTFFARARTRTGATLSGPSNEVQFTLGCAAPAPPSPLAFSKAGPLLTLTWAASPSAIYRLYAGTAPGLSNVLDVELGTAPGVQANISGVAAGTYYVRVAARNACGLGAPSNEVAIPVP